MYSIKAPNHQSIWVISSRDGNLNRRSSTGSVSTLADDQHVRPFPADNVHERRPNFGQSFKGYSVTPIQLGLKLPLSWHLHGNKGIDSNIYSIHFVVSERGGSIWKLKFIIARQFLAYLLHTYYVPTSPRKWPVYALLLLKDVEKDANSVRYLIFHLHTCLF